MRGAIFDLDGTLIDSMGYWADVAGKYLKSKNIEIDGETQKACDTLPVHISSVFIKNKYKLEESPEKISTDIYKIIEDNYKLDIPLKNDVLDFLKKLKKQGVKMCIATATDRIMVEYVIKRLDISGYFEFIITCKEVEAAKAESPLVYEEALKKLGTEKKETIVFEDAAHAIATAKKAGFYVVGVYDDYFKTEKDKIIEMADQFIYSYDELSVPGF